MRHADHDLARAAPRRALDGLVEHRHQRVDALDREPLHADVRVAEEALEAVDLGEPLEQRALLVVGERRGRFARSIVSRNHSRSASSLEVLELEARSCRSRGRASAGRRRPPCRRSNRRAPTPGTCCEIRFGDAVELRLQLGRAGRRRAERIELDREMAVALDRVDERGGAGDFAKQRRVVARRGAGTGASELFGDAEKLAPGFVDRRRIATVCLVHLGDLAVVENAGDGKAGHSAKSKRKRRHRRLRRRRSASELRPCRARSELMRLRAVDSARVSSVAGRGVNADPLFGSDSTSIRPPSNSARPREM